MSIPQPTGWQAIQAEVLRRIHARDWPPGHVIPGEVDLATEFGCARATVNRALRTLAEAGVLERRRKAGTRVALHPVSRATVDIPILRQEIEARGSVYGYRLLSREVAAPPDTLLPQITRALHVRALHLADHAPFVLEDRWINLAAVPAAAGQSFSELSANEWLISTAPYTHGEIAFAARAASPTEADALDTAPAAPLFAIKRTTWDQQHAVTYVTLTYAPGYEICTTIGG